jgi:hypothetical protein
MAGVLPTTPTATRDDQQQLYQQQHGDLAAHPCDYLYSSAKFYCNRENSFEILQHYADV